MITNTNEGKSQEKDYTKKSDAMGIHKGSTYIWGMIRVCPESAQKGSIHTKKSDTELSWTIAPDLREGTRDQEMFVLLGVGPVSLWPADSVGVREASHVSAKDQRSGQHT